MWHQELSGTKNWRTRRRNRFHKRPPTVNLENRKVRPAHTRRQRGGTWSGRCKQVYWQTSIWPVPS
jgi:hypothetical protein